MDPPYPWIQLSPAFFDLQWVLQLMKWSLRPICLLGRIAGIFLQRVLSTNLRQYPSNDTNFEKPFRFF
jgi:hypothetical protein